MRGLSRAGGYDRGPVRVGNLDDDLNALANLRTFRGKLNAVIARSADPQRIYLFIDARPPSWADGTGALGGNDQYLTPDNLGVVNWSLVTSGEALIAIEKRHTAEDGVETTELGVSKESIGQLLVRVSRAIDHLVARIHGR